MKLYVDASSLSALAGRHPHRSADVEILKLIARHYSTVWEKILTYYQNLDSKFLTAGVEPNQSLSLTEQANMLEISPDVPLQVAPLRQTQEQRETKAFEEYKQAQPEQVAQFIETPQAVPDLPKEVETACTKERGKVKESFVFGRLQTYFHGTLKYDNTLITRSCGNWKIGGRIDAYLPNGVIEIKTRKYRCFGREKLCSVGYDIDQLAVYAFLLPERRDFYICEYDGRELYLHQFSQEELLQRWEEMKAGLSQVEEKLKEAAESPGALWIDQAMRSSTFLA